MRCPLAGCNKGVFTGDYGKETDERVKRMGEGFFVRKFAIGESVLRVRISDRKDDWGDIEET